MLQRCRTGAAYHPCPPAQVHAGCPGTSPQLRRLAAAVPYYAQAQVTHAWSPAPAAMKSCKPLASASRSALMRQQAQHSPAPPAGHACAGLAASAQCCQTSLICAPHLNHSWVSRHAHAVPQSAAAAAVVVAAEAQHEDGACRGGLPVQLRAHCMQHTQSTCSLLCCRRQLREAVVPRGCGGQQRSQHPV